MNLFGINCCKINRQKLIFAFVSLAIATGVLVFYNTTVTAPSAPCELCERLRRPIKVHKTFHEEWYFNTLYNNYTYTTGSTTADEPKELVKQVDFKLNRPILYFYNKFYRDLKDREMSECPKYNNCIIVDGHRNRNRAAFLAASVVIFQSTFQNLNKLPIVDPSIRQKQLWALKSLEAPAYQFNKYPSTVNGKFNFTINYRLDATITSGYAPRLPLQKYETRLPKINYKAKKSPSKGGFTVISNCQSSGFDRLAIIKQLAKYVPIDIYGRCGKKSPCIKRDIVCESKLYNDYHFFVSFENSLCKDYITEKFWERLASDALFIPIAMGGTSLDDYLRIAPPNSFLHLYNFTSVKDLGLHMKKLMDNQDAYNSYHHWREQYVLKSNFPGGRILTPIPSCTLCEYANEMPSMPPIDHLASWWNSACKSK